MRWRGRSPLSDRRPSPSPHTPPTPPTHPSRSLGALFDSARRLVALKNASTAAAGLAGPEARAALASRVEEAILLCDAYTARFEQDEMHVTLVTVYSTLLALQGALAK